MFTHEIYDETVSVAAPSKTWVCGRSFAWIAGSNPAEGMDFCLLWVFYFARLRSLRRADHSSRGVLLTVVHRSVIVNPTQWGSRIPSGAAALWDKTRYKVILFLSTSWTHIGGRDIQWLTSRCTYFSSRKETHFPLNRKLCGPQNPSGPFGEETYFL